MDHAPAPDDNDAVDWIRDHDGEPSAEASAEQQAGNPYSPNYAGHRGDASCFVPGGWGICVCDWPDPYRRTADENPF